MRDAEPRLQTSAAHSPGCGLCAAEVGSRNSEGLENSGTTRGTSVSTVLRRGAGSGRSTSSAAVHGGDGPSPARRSLHPSARWVWRGRAPQLSCCSYLPPSPSTPMTPVCADHLQRLQVRCSVEPSCSAARCDQLLIGYDFCEPGTARLGLTVERRAVPALPCGTLWPLPVRYFARADGDSCTVQLSFRSVDQGPTSDRDEQHGTRSPSKSTRKCDSQRVSSLRPTSGTIQRNG